MTFPYSRINSDMSYYSPFGNGITDIKSFCLTIEYPCGFAPFYVVGSNYTGVTPSDGTSWIYGTGIVIRRYYTVDILWLTDSDGFAIGRYNIQNDNFTWKLFPFNQ